jgi:uncharacterized protein YecT (DUF1311 family)
MKSILFSICMMALIISSCNQNQTQQDSCKQLDAIDKKMLDTYDQIKTAYNTDERFLSKLNMSQVYWVQYRDRHLEALYPLKRKEYQEGDWENFTECECDEMVRLTKARIETLNMWLSGGNPYDSCPSSIQ